MFFFAVYVKYVKIHYVKFVYGLSDGHVIFLGLVLGRRVCYGAFLKFVENLCRCCSKFSYNLFSMYFGLVRGWFR